MAIIDKAAIQALIDAYDAKILLYITSNNNKDITGAQLKQILDESSVILEQIKDSYFNLLNEPRTALSTSYDPTTALDWGDTIPTEVRESLDILIKKVSTNASENIAYVSETGSDTVNEFEVGNPLKPFATFLTAWDAMPNEDFTIKALGGTYTQEFSVSNKDNFVIDISGCDITFIDLGFRLLNCSNAHVNCEGSVITGNLNFSGGGGEKISLTGGQIQGNLKVGEKSYISNSNITNNLSVIDGEIIDINNRAYFSNCRIIGTGTQATISDGSSLLATFSNCFIQGLNTAIEPSSIAGRYSKYLNCSILASGSSSQVIRQSGGVLQGIFKQCRIQATTGQVIFLGGLSGSNNVFFEDCDIIAESDCVFIDSNLIRLASTKTTFKRCSFYTNVGDIFTGTPNASDLGVTSLIGTTFTNKSLLVLTNFEVLGDQITDVNAQIPPL